MAGRRYLDYFFFESFGLSLCCFEKSRKATLDHHEPMDSGRVSSAVQNCPRHLWGFSNRTLQKTSFLFKTQFTYKNTLSLVIQEVVPDNDTRTTRFLTADFSRTECQKWDFDTPLRSGEHEDLQRETRNWFSAVVVI